MLVLDILKNLYLKEIVLEVMLKEEDIGWYNKNLIKRWFFICSLLFIF